MWKTRIFWQFERWEYSTILSECSSAYSIHFHKKSMKAVQMEFCNFSLHYSWLYNYSNCPSGIYLYILCLYLPSTSLAKVHWLETSADVSGSIQATLSWGALHLRSLPTASRPGRHTGTLWCEDQDRPHGAEMKLQTSREKVPLLRKLLGGQKMGGCWSRRPRYLYLNRFMFYTGWEIYSISWWLF